MTAAGYYTGFQARADKIKNDFLVFLIEANRAGKKVAAYGAAAKGNTLLNYAGVRPDLLPWVVDRNPSKQDKYLPGSRIPIVDEGRLRAERPDYIVILPWNLRDESDGTARLHSCMGRKIRHGGSGIAGGLMSAMKIAVTGASGFIGRYVLAELARQPVDVVAVTRDAARLAGPGLSKCPLRRLPSMPHR